ncbi:unnamed protein product [Urochloa humidicola]
MVVAWRFCFSAWVVQVPALLCCEAMVWALTFLAFPLRMLTAIERERKLGRLIGEMQAQMEDLVWVNRELEDKLQAALREHDAMDALLDEMEDEQEDAYARIEALEAQLRALRQENMRLNEHKGKSMWDKAPARPGNKALVSETEDTRTPWVASGRSERGDEEAAAGTAQYDDDAGFKFKSADPASVLSLTTPPAEDDDAVARQEEESKAVARRRSVFSVGMSVAVGGVAWWADAACLPLLAGLFAVVGVSMRSVSRCRAADAVALLSLNWFLLGLLTSPMLPALLPRAPRAIGGPALAASFAAAAPATD